jgi:hypothetical protein
MTDCVVYTLFAADGGSLVDRQVVALQQYATGCRVVVVEDGHYPCKPLLTVPHITVVPRKVTPSSGFRSALLADCLFAWEVQRQAERYAIFIHGDMIPITSFTSTSLFRGNSYVVAGRYPPGSLRPYWATQLLGVDREAGTIPPWYAWDHTKATVYPVRVQRCVDEYHTEWIGPFKHLVAMNKTIAGESSGSASIAKIPQGYTSHKEADSEHSSRRRKHWQAVDSLGIAVGNGLIEQGKREQPTGDGQRCGGTRYDPATDKATPASHVKPPFVSDEVILHRKAKCSKCKWLRHTKYDQPYCRRHCKRNGKKCQPFGVGKYQNALLAVEPWCKPWRKLR